MGQDKRRAGIMRVSFGVLQRMLLLPTDVRVTAAHVTLDDFHREQLSLRLEGGDLPEVEYAARLGEVEGVFQETEHGPELVELRPAIDPTVGQGVGG